MVANAGKETNLTIIHNCFRKAGFKHRAVDPDQVPEEPPVAPAPDVWNKVQRWMGDVQFDDFVASECEANSFTLMSNVEKTLLLSIQSN